MTYMTARCPVCHRPQTVIPYKWGFRFAEHRSGSRTCSGSGSDIAAGAR